MSDTSEGAGRSSRRIEWLIPIGALFLVIALGGLVSGSYEEDGGLRALLFTIVGAGLLVAGLVRQRRA